MSGGPTTGTPPRQGTVPRMAGPVSVVVIAYNDVGRLAAAVTSALAQGDVVGEVIVVDDASSDGTGALADRLAEANPRVRVRHRPVNSGGCGTPRNDGMDLARGRWVVFLDSDDLLPPEAGPALLAAANRHGADVVAGLCVRLELPDGRRTPWCPDLFAEESVHDGLAGRPETVHDTLSVNKLYRRGFLVRHGIRFPDGARHYEDFVFTGRLYAAAPRFAVIPDTVYVWHVRSAGATPSISQRRDRIGNWLDRLASHHDAVEALAAGGGTLAVAAEAKFVGYDLPMYLRDLHRRPADYQQQWWSATRAYLSTLTPRALAGAGACDRWRAAVVLGRPCPGRADVGRLAELSAVPPRLAPPYAGGAAGALWDLETPAVPLSGVAGVPLGELPLCVSARVRVRRQGITLALTLRELYGRVAAAGPDGVEVELRHRVDGTVLRRPARWREADGAGWRSEVAFDVSELREPAAMASWDVWARLGFGSGERLAVKVRAGGGLGRSVAVDNRGSVVLVQPHATVDRSLAFRVADGMAGARRVVAGRLARTAGG